jgi:hypothetical protein
VLPPIRIEVLAVVRSVDGGVSVTLTNGEQTGTIRKGEAFADLRLESVGPELITFTHVPTGLPYTRALSDRSPAAGSQVATVQSAPPQGPFANVPPPPAAPAGAASQTGQAGISTAPEGTVPPQGITTPPSLTAAPPQGFSSAAPNLPPPQGSNAVPPNLPPPQGVQPNTPSGTMPQGPAQNRK